MPRLENWYILSNKSFFTAPEIKNKLSGVVYGHRFLPDGTNVSTTEIINLDLVNMVAETQNTIYMLGEISPEYKKWCKDNGIQHFDI